MIPPGHFEPAAGGALSGPLIANEHYFQVRINEMFLTTERRWFSEYMPMVLAVTEFKYADEHQVVPFTVGPSLLDRDGAGQATPTGMVFTDTRVAGIHPYRGDRLVLSVRLYQLKIGDHAKRILSLVEGAADALDFSTALSSYMKVADVVLEGVEGLMGLGDLNPVVGLRTEFDPNAGNGIDSPAFFALIDAPGLDPSTLWVRGNRLYTGASSDASQPYRAADYVLYSVVGSVSRDDAPSLSWFGPLWNRVVHESNVAKDEAWTNAKANMSVLNEALLLSPDMTMGHALLLGDKQVEQMKAIHQRAVGMASLSVEEDPTSPAETLRNRSLAILDL
jgi:hypothetical protein